MRLNSSKKAFSLFFIILVIFLVSLSIGFVISSVLPNLGSHDICNDITNVKVIIDENNACYSEINQTHNLLTFNIMNNANSSVEGYYILLTSDFDKLVYRNYTTFVDAYGTISVNHIFKDIGFLKNVKFSFYRKFNEDLVLCDNQLVIISDIGKC